MNIKNVISWFTRKQIFFTYYDCLKWKKKFVKKNYRKSTNKYEFYLLTRVWTPDPQTPRHSAQAPQGSHFPDFVDTAAWLGCWDQGNFWEKALVPMANKSWDFPTIVDWSITSVWGFQNNWKFYFNFNIIW